MTAHENKILGEGLTYDDVLLVPAYSEILPREVSIKTKFSMPRAKSRSFRDSALGTIRY